MEVAVDAHGGARVVEAEQPVDEGTGRAQVESLGGETVQLALHGLGPMLRVPRLAAEGLGHGQVHAGRDRPHPPGFGSEVATGRLRPGMLGLASLPPTGRDGGTLRAPDLVRGRVQVPQRRQGQRPSLRPSGQELLGEGQLPGPSPPDEHGSGDVVEAHGVQRRGHLDVGVRTPAEAPEELDDELVVVDDRCVGLLGADGTDAPGPHPALAGHLQQLEVEHRVHRGLVGQGRAEGSVDHAHHGVVAAPRDLGRLGLGPGPHQHLIGPSAGVDQHPGQPWRALGQLVVLHQLQAGELALRRALGSGVPALTHEEAGQQPQQLVHQRRIAHVASSTSCSQ